MPIKARNISQTNALDDPSEQPVATPVAEIEASTVPSGVPPKCTVEDMGENIGLLVTFYIGPVESKRIRSRAGVMPLSRYLYENILNRAVADHVW